MLSTAKYRPLVAKAKSRGFEVRLIYIYVDTVERQLERIRLRVAKGGHDVPSTKVAERRAKSFYQLGWFFWEAHRAWVFDNSGAEPKLVALKEQTGLAELSGEIAPELRSRILEAHLESLKA